MNQSIVHETVAVFKDLYGNLWDLVQFDRSSEDKG